MTITMLSSQELDQDLARAKKVTKHGPVIITDGGKPAYVLLSFEDYQRLTRQRHHTTESLGMPQIADIEFEPQRAEIQARPADFS